MIIPLVYTFLHVSNLQIDVLGLQQKWQIVMLSVVCNLCIFLNFSVNPLRFSWHKGRAWIRECDVHLRQIISHHAFKNRWMVNRIQDGLSQLVMMLEKSDTTFESCGIMNQWGLILWWIRSVGSHTLPESWMVLLAVSACRSYIDVD